VTLKILSPKLKEEIDFEKVQISSEKKGFFVITSNLHTNVGVSEHTASDVRISVKFEEKLSSYLKKSERRYKEGVRFFPSFFQIRFT
jgi:hypothetical protein